MARKTRPSAPTARGPEAGPPTPPVAQHARGPFGEAESALARGDVRTARALLRTLAESGPEQDRAAARARLARMTPDPAALVTVAIVAVLILIATWLAIFRR